jgi:hypothetical protein
MTDVLLHVRAARMRLAWAARNGVAGPDAVARLASELRAHLDAIEALVEGTAPAPARPAPVGRGLSADDPRCPPAVRSNLRRIWSAGRAFALQARYLEDDPRPWWIADETVGEQFATASEAVETARHWRDLHEFPLRPRA